MLLNYRLEKFIENAAARAFWKANWFHEYKVTHSFLFSLGFLLYLIFLDRFRYLFLQVILT